jgi:hypothetical protein
MGKTELKVFHLVSVMKQGYPLFPLLFNRVLEFLARTIRQGKGMDTHRQGRIQIIPTSHPVKMSNQNRCILKTTIGK